MWNFVSRSWAQKPDLQTHLLHFIFSLLAFSERWKLLHLYTILPIAFDERVTFWRQCAPVSASCAALYVCDWIMIIRSQHTKYNATGTCTGQWLDVFKPKKFSLSHRQSNYTHCSPSQLKFASNVSFTCKICSKASWGKFQQNFGNSLTHNALQFDLLPLTTTIVMAINYNEVLFGKNLLANFTKGFFFSSW